MVASNTFPSLRLPAFAVGCTFAAMWLLPATNAGIPEPDGKELASTVVDGVKISLAGVDNVAQEKYVYRHDRSRLNMTTTMNTDSFNKQFSKSGKNGTANGKLQGFGGDGGGGLSLIHI